MKRLQIIPLLAVLSLLAARPATAQSDADRDAVRRAALDYVEGFYEGGRWMISHVLWQTPPRR